jgi:DNA-binding SARP family transcriptional activator
VANTISSLRLLGGFDLVCAGTTVALPMSAQRLLAFIALHDRALQRSFVAGSLWLDSPEERAYGNLRTALWRLHRGGLTLVQSRGQQLSLSPEVDVDLRCAEAVAHNALHGGRPTAVADDVSLLCEDLLPDWYDDWVVLERERHRQLRLRALERLCGRLTEEGDLDAALDVGLAAVAGEPLRESGHRAVIRVHLAAGNASEAIREYRLCRRLLREQLGIEPSAQMEQLVGDLHAVETAR